MLFTTTMKAFCYEKLINIQVPTLFFRGPDGWGLSAYLKYTSRLFNWNFSTTPQLPTWPLFLMSVPLLHVGHCHPLFPTFPVSGLQKLSEKSFVQFEMVGCRTYSSFARSRSLHLLNFSIGQPRP